MRAFLSRFGDAPKEAGLKLLSDRPTSDDRLGTHKSIAETLRDVICSDLKKPFVVGLFGSWGSGKSSVLEILKASEDKSFRLVVIDAWRKDKDNFLRQFIKKLARELLNPTDAEDVANTVSKRSSHRRSWWKTDKTADNWIIGFLITTLVLLICLVVLTLRYPNVPSAPLGNLALLALATAVFQWIVRKHSFDTDITEEEITLDDPAWFRDVYFNKIILKIKAPVVCVAIDNLDRVPVDDALKIIRTVKTFIVDGPEDALSDATERVMFLVPCDFDALAARMKSDGSINAPEEFLRKFFNVSITVPMMQEQDAFPYVRELLTEAGLTYTEDVLDRLTFVIVSATRRSPRHPKHFINCFLAKLHLAQQFEFAEKAATDHPDWLAVCVALETEFREQELPWTAEELQSHVREIVQASPGRMYVGIPSRQDFLRQMQYIVAEISPDAWYSFRFLKKSNVHARIPDFRHLAEEGFGLKLEEFRQRLPKVYGEHPNIISSLWSERKDHLSRMNLMHSILAAIEAGVKCDLPTRVISEMAELIAWRIAGWYELPARASYECILKLRHASLSTVLSNGAEEAKKQAPNGCAFVSSIVKSVMADNHGQTGFSVEVVKVLDAYAAQDSALTEIALSYPQYFSRPVFEAARTLWRNPKSTLSLRKLVVYVANMPPPPLNQLNQSGGDLLTEISAALQQRPQALREEGFEGIQLLVDDLANGRIPIQSIQYEAMGRFVDALIHAHDSVLSRGDAGSYCIASSMVKLASLTLPNINMNVVHTNAEAFAREFLERGKEEYVANFLAENDKYIEQHCRDAVDSVGCRSEKLFTAVINSFPTHRHSLVTLAATRSPNLITAWSKNDASSLEGADRAEISRTLIGLAAQRQYNMSLYEAVRALGATGVAEVHKALESHFDQLLGANKPLSVEKNLETVLARMQALDYKPTKTQYDALDEGKRSIDHKTVSETLRTLIRDVLGT